MPARRAQARGEITVERLLAVVEQAQAPADQVQAEIALVGDEQDAWTLGHVVVVGDVDEQMVGNGARLDPAMEDGDELTHRKGAVGAGDLDPDAMEVGERGRHVDGPQRVRGEACGRRTPVDRRVRQFRPSRLTTCDAAAAAGPAFCCVMRS